MYHRASRLLIACIFCWIAVLSPQVRAADQGALDASMPADAYLIGRMDLNRILASPLGPVLLQDVRENYEAINWFFSTVFGFELAVVDSLWFALDPSDRRVILLEGRYQTDVVVERLGAMPGWNRLSYLGVPLASAFRDQADNELIAAVLDENLIAIGDSAVMRVMLAGRAARLEAGEPARAGIARVDASSAELAVAMLNGKSPIAVAAGFEVLQSAWLEGRFDDDLDLLIEAVAVDERLAAGLEQIIAGGLLIAEVHPQVRAEAAYLQAVRDARVQRDARTVSTATVLRRRLLEQR